MNKIKKTIEVVAAIIFDGEKILCVQRGENKYPYISKKYEFPGGKIEPGESLEQTVVREIKEELNMKILPQTKFVTIKHEYPDFNLIMHSFKCHCSNTNMKLTEHIDFKWLPINQLKSLDWAAADIPIVNELMH